MHRKLHHPSSDQAVLGRPLARRLAGALLATAVAGSLLGGASAAQAATVTPPPGPPIGNFERVTAATGGLTVRGWAADRDTTGPLTLKVTAGGTTRTITTTVARPDVTKVFPDLGPTTGFEVLIPLPAGSQQVCVTAVNVGAGADKVFPCLTSRAVPSEVAEDADTETQRRCRFSGQTNAECPVIPRPMMRACTVSVPS